MGVFKVAMYFTARTSFIQKVFIDRNRSVNRNRDRNRLSRVGSLNIVVRGTMPKEVLAGDLHAAPIILCRKAQVDG